MAQVRHNRPWHLLAVEFAGATTMHGIRFLVEPTKFVTRRLRRLNCYPRNFTDKTIIEVWSICRGVAITVLLQELLKITK